METTLRLSAYEDILMNIVRSLPAERVMQILDYASYIQSQTVGPTYEDETDEEIRADEEHWDFQFASTQDCLSKMSDKIRAEIRTGRTIPMNFSKEGKIIKG